MSNTYTETILFELPLPSFLLDFKNAFNSIVIPKLMTIIQDIQKRQSNSSFLSILILILLFFMVKSVVANLFEKKPQVNKQVTQPQIDQQIRALANEIRNLKNSLKKIIQQAGKNKQVSLQNQTGRESINPEDVNKLIKFYKEAAQDFSNLANFILESQVSIFTQLKNVKRMRVTQKTSSHGSREDSIFQQLSPTKQLQQSKSVDEGSLQTRVEENKQQVPLQVKSTPRPIIKAPLQPPGKRKVAPPPPPVGR